MATRRASLGRVIGNVARSTNKASTKKTTKTTTKTTSKTTRKKEEEKKKSAVVKADPRQKTESHVLSPREKTAQKNAKKAYESYKKADTNALGTKSKTQTSGSKNTLKSNLEKVGTRASVTGDAKKEVNKSLKNLSTEEKKKVIRDYVKKQDWKTIDKQIEKANDTRVKSKDLNAEDYLRIQNATRLTSPTYTNNALGGGGDLTDIRRKVASRNALDYGKGGVSTAAQEFMNAASVSPTNLYNGYNYTQAEKNAIQQGKDSTAGKIGYMTGIGASAMFGGVTGMESAVGKMLYKQGGKSTAKRFLADRGADMIINSGVDALDSIKSATDMNGNIDLAQAGKNMLLNEAMNVGVGSIMGGGGLALKKMQVKKALVLKNKLEKGMELDDADKKLMAKINANQLDDEYAFVNDAIGDTRNQVRRKMADEQRPQQIASQFNNGEVVTDNTVEILQRMKKEDSNINAPRSQQVIEGAGRKVSDTLDRLKAEDKAKADQQLANEMADARTPKAEPKAEEPKVEPKKVEEEPRKEKTELQKAQSGAKEIAESKAEAEKEVARLKRELDYYKKNLADEDAPEVSKQKISEFNSKIRKAQARAKGKPTTDNLTTLRNRESAQKVLLENARSKEDIERLTKELADTRAKIAKIEKKNAPKPEKPKKEKPKKEKPKVEKVEEKVDPKQEKLDSLKAELDQAKIDYKRAVDMHSPKTAEHSMKVFNLEKEIKALEKEMNPPKVETKVEEPKVETKAEPPKAEKVEETPKTEQTKVEETSTVETPKAEPKAEVKEEPKPEDLKGTKTEKVKKVDDEIDAKFKDDNTDVTTDDIIKNMKDGKKKLDQLIKGKALSRTYKRFAKWALENANDKGKAFDMLSDMKISGEGNKRVYTNMEQAVTKAEADVKADFDKVYNRVMSVDNKPDGTLAYDPYTYRAESQELLNELIDRFNKTGNLDDLDKIRKLAADNIDKGSQAGHALNACKLILRETPEGRLQLAMSELKRLNKKFGDRLKSPLELTDDEMRMVLDAVKQEDVDKAFKQINDRLWSDIPSTAMEKFNEWRHFTMLANPKTHMRNTIGNGIFGIARQMSNCIEIGLAKGVQKAMKNSDKTFEMSAWVSKKELKDNKKLLDEQWDKWYSNTDSQNRYIESVRPQGMTEIRNKPMSKMIQFNYDWLEKEDRWFLKPAYERNFMRYCKAHDIDLKNPDPKALEKASKYAEKQALYATYRDTSELSTLLTGLKQKTAGKKGKTALGTAGYRTANMVIESALPFVKTPVNVFGRMVDYSPMGLIKSLANLHSWKAKGDYDKLADAIHYMSTGLTGSGITLLGGYLAHEGIIMTKAGEVSGDAFYDRDMGYQDYSLMFDEKVPFLGGKSISADWVAPMATSLFMGASAYESLSDKGYDYKDIINGIGAMVNPMLEMSFMSGSKDMIETFMENAIDRSTGETHWSEAVFTSVFGSIPQNYLQSMMTSQILGQTAQGMDKYQRDTSSTKEDPMLKSWDSWRRKIMNRWPGFRQMLNKKVDRQGKDVETFGGDNLVTRWMNAIFNPSTTKRITFNDTDKELISIYNSMPDGKEKTYFFYNFTGNPSYDLGDLGRMTYEQKYEYTKENRTQQNRLVKEMIKDPGYQYMTNDQKATEVNKAHWLSTTIADRKAIGDDYALKKIISDSDNETEKNAYEYFKTTGGDKKDFLDYYVIKENIRMKTHTSNSSIGYYDKALAAVEYDRLHTSKNGDVLAEAFGAYQEKYEAAKSYLDDGGSMQEYVTASRMMNGTIAVNGASDSAKNRAVAAGTYEDGKINPRVYSAMGISGDIANTGYGLSKGAITEGFSKLYSIAKLQKMKNEMTAKFNTDDKKSISKEECKAYIDSLDLDNQVEKACLFTYLYGYQTKKNPYGGVPNFIGSEYTETSSSGGSGRRGWGRRRGHGGGGSGGASYESYDSYMKRMYGSSSGSSSTTSKSNLTEAFRKQQLKKLQNTTGTYKA